MYVREQIPVMVKQLLELETVLCRQAKQYQNTVMPGYTHLQRAQPITFAQHLLAYGSMLSRDVTRLEDIILWYGTRFQVNLGNSANLGYKVACMNDVILQMSDYQSGILDISFTIWPTQVGYTPFA